MLTPVGLLPVAVAGIDIHALFRGATDTLVRLASPKNNPALLYAAIRSALLQQGLCIDLLSVFEPALCGFGRWWQQLFGESEGKNGTGLFPFVAQYSTDLHSIGQYVQEGKRSLMETFLMVERTGNALSVPEEPGTGSKNLDGLDYLAGRSIETINRAAWEGTARAHTDGGVPNMTLWMEEMSPTSLGEAIYFFEHAVSISGYLLRVNPFRPAWSRSLQKRDVRAAWQTVNQRLACGKIGALDLELFPSDVERVCGVNKFFCFHGLFQGYPRSLACEK